VRTISVDAKTERSYEDRAILRRCGIVGTRGRYCRWNVYLWGLRVVTWAIAELWGESISEMTQIVQWWVPGF